VGAGNKCKHYRETDNPSHDDTSSILFDFQTNMDPDVEQAMNMQKIASLRAIDRRQFIRMCAGSMALAALSCGRSKDRTPADNTKVTVLY